MNKVNKIIQLDSILLMLRKIPLAMVGLIVGSIITTIGIIAYPLNYAALNLNPFPIVKSQRQKLLH